MLLQQFVDLVDMRWVGELQVVRSFGGSIPCFLEREDTGNKEFPSQAAPYRTLGGVGSIGICFRFSKFCKVRKPSNVRFSPSSGPKNIKNRDIFKRSARGFLLLTTK